MPAQPPHPAPPWQGVGIMPRPRASRASDRGHHHQYPRKSSPCRCRGGVKTVWLVENGCVSPLKLPNKYIHPIKWNNYSLTNKVLKNYSFKAITATSLVFHFIAAYASKNNKLNGDLMGTRDQLRPRDFLPGFHENNCIIMVCDINIDFGKVRQQLHREGCSMSKHSGMCSIWQKRSGIFLQVASLLAWNRKVS